MRKILFILFNFFKVADDLFQGREKEKGTERDTG